MHTDYLGNPVSSSRVQTIEGIDHFISGFLSYHPKMQSVLSAADNDPEAALANAYAGFLYMFLEAPNAPELATPYIERAAACANANDRERKIIAIAKAWSEDDMARALSLCEAVLKDHPRDLATQKLAQYFLFNAGDALNMLRFAMFSLDSADDVAQMHGMAAFAYEQCHLLDEAEKAARRALERDPHEPWAHHAIAHVCLTQGRIDEGLAFLEEVAHSWAPLNSFLYTHNWWHVGLCHIARGRFDEALEIYDTHLWTREKEYSQDQIGAVSMLARLEMAGADVGSRWEELGDYLSARTADTVQPFLSLQYLYGLARAGRGEASALFEAIRQRAEQEQGSDGPWTAVALPTAEGLMAYIKGDNATAALKLGRALPRMAEIGGSHAQRDLFEQFHLDALLRAGQFSKAQQILETRRASDPEDVPANRQLAEIYRRCGLEGLAQAAQARIAGL